VSRSKTALRSTYSADLEEAPAALPAPAAPADPRPPLGTADGASPAAGAEAAAAEETPQELLPVALAPSYRGGGGGGNGGSDSPVRGSHAAIANGGGAPPLSPRAGSLDERFFSALLDWPGGGPGGNPSGAGALPPAHLLFGGPPAAAAEGSTAAPGARSPMMRPKSRYLVLLVDGTDSAARLGALLSARSKAGGGVAGGARALMAALAGAAGASVGVGVASAFGLHDTLRLLACAGLGPRDADFLITNAGSQIWYGGSSAPAPAGAGAGAGAAPSRAGAPAGLPLGAEDDPGAEELEVAARRCVADEAFGAFVDQAWDKISVRRVLAQLLAQRGLLAGLAAASAAAAAGSEGDKAAAAKAPGAQLRVTADTETGAHHLLLTLRRAGGGGGGRPALGAAELAALVARVKKRFRCSGLRTNGERAAGGGGEAGDVRQGRAAAAGCGKGARRTRACKAPAASTCAAALCPPHASSSVMAQIDADGAARLHVTPLRASRALALRYLAHRHGVDLGALVAVRWGAGAAPGGWRAEAGAAGSSPGRTPCRPARRRSRPPRVRFLGPVVVKCDAASTLTSAAGGQPRNRRPRFPRRHRVHLPSPSPSPPLAAAPLPPPQLRARPRTGQRRRRRALRDE
jgi:hypothetical protein